MEPHEGGVDEIRSLSRDHTEPQRDSAGVWEKTHEIYDETRLHSKYNPNHCQIPHPLYPMLLKVWLAGL
jgi:hypothetical protein